MEGERTWRKGGEARGRWGGRRGSRRGGVDEGCRNRKEGRDQLQNSTEPLSTGRAHEGLVDSLLDWRGKIGDGRKGVSSREEREGDFDELAALSLPPSRPQQQHQSNLSKRSSSHSYVRSTGSISFSTDELLNRALLSCSVLSPTPPRRSLFPRPFTNPTRSFGLSDFDGEFKRRTFASCTQGEPKAAELVQGGRPRLFFPFPLSCDTLQTVFSLPHSRTHQMMNQHRFMPVQL